MKHFARIFLLSLILFSCSYSQGIKEFNSTDDAMNYLVSLTPKESAFTFHKPIGWKIVSLSSAKIIHVSNGEDIKEAEKIIDGNTNTSWKTNDYYKKPEVIIDFGEIKKFNKIIIYNRQSINRGSGGGNNALKTVNISYSSNANSEYRTYGKFELTGPKALCVNVKGGGHICTFIDNTKPNIIKVPSTEARYLRLDFIDAFWSEDIPNNWRDSFSLTEIMLFQK